jgi:membrane-bound lytic murein transglycosylase D
VIAKDPERYGFETNRDQPVEFDVVQIEAPMDLGTAAECVGASLDEMKSLNPELRRWVTPLNRPDYALKIPLGTKDAFCEAVQSIPPEKRVRFLAYTVRRGDTLSHIARRYGTSINALVDANRIGRRSIIRPGQVLTVPVPHGTSAIVRSVATKPRTPVNVAEGDLYTVRPGDTLGEIAEAHGIGLSKLRSWNGLGRRSLIHPGQKLVVRESQETSDGRRLTYRVRRGDTLTKIAQRFSVSIEEIRRWNNLANDRIVAGESLAIYTSGY